MNIVGVVTVIILFGMCISSLSICLVSVFKTRERVMGIAQAIIMPLFFASNAIFPVSIMPKWLQAIVVINPLTYVVSALRALLISGDFGHLLRDMVALTIITLVFVFLATIGFRRVID